MTVLFCTPMYGGQCTEGYFQGSLLLQESLLSRGIDHSWLTTSNESLIPRARNTMVSTFLKTSFEFLFFIDADIRFRPEDVLKLLKMNKPVSVGVYRMKREGSAFAAWVDGELLNDLPDEPVKVDYAGTGFMCIRRDVFGKMIESYPETRHEEGHVGECHALFDTAVKDGVYLSEDYLFCERWREIGGEIWMDPMVRLGHIGTKVYE